MNNAFTPIDPDRSDTDLVGIAETLVPGEVPPHRHQRAQLIYAARGAMSVTTEAGVWVLPTSRALWVPAGEWHSLHLRRSVELRTIYLSNTVDGLPNWPRCFVVAVPPLVRELLLSTVADTIVGRSDAAARRLVRVLLDRLAALPELPVHLPEPRDMRARRMAALLRADPAALRSIDNLATAAGSSRRTLERLFLEETGLALGSWRHQFRLLHGLDLLAAGTMVGEAAFSTGYQNPSSFIAVFKRAFGTTPAKYFG